MPGFAGWLLGEPVFAGLPNVRAQRRRGFESAREHLRALCGGDLGALQAASLHDKLDKESQSALLALCSAYLLHLSPTAMGTRWHVSIWTMVRGWNG